MFNEANTVEAYLRSLLCGSATANSPPDAGFSRQGRKLNGLGWHYLPPQQLPRQPQEVFIEPFVRDALIRLNPEIAANPDRAEEVLYKLRAIALSVRSDGLIRANEEFTAWFRGDRTMPFGPSHEHTTVCLIDFEKPENNQWAVTNQYTFRAGAVEKGADLVLLVNGFPLVLIEAKTPVRQAVS
jgi:type I restriction enzyme R subunit